jgi:hypothetical protein
MEHTHDDRAEDVRDCPACRERRFHTGTGWGR